MAEVLEFRRSVPGSEAAADEVLDAPTIARGVYFRRVRVNGRPAVYAVAANADEIAQMIVPIGATVKQVRAAMAALWGILDVFDPTEVTP